MGFIYELRNSVRSFNRMANKAKDEKDVRKLTKVGGKSISVTLPIEMVRELGWKEKQKVVVKRVHGGVMIKDWKK